MDTFLFCLLATYAVARGINFANGEGDILSPGLAVRQGEPTSVIAQKNGELLLNCSVEHEPSLGPLNITWQQNGGPVEIGKRIQLMSNGSLYIRRIIHRPKKSRTDVGLYDCVASLPNIGSIIARRVRVQVAGIEKKFDKEPQSQKVAVGGVAWFQCQIEAVPPAIYIWERNGTQLPQQDSRFIKLSSGILQIINVQEGDTGSYRCHATQGSLHELPEEVDNIYGKTSAEAFLKVDRAPETRPVVIHSSTRNVTARVGSTTILECLVDGYSDVVQWKRDNDKVIEFNKRIKRVANNLKFVDVELSDSGRYQCIAGTEVAILKLNVIAPPVITKGPKSAKVPKAKWIYLDCEADGSPKPSLTWLKNGKPILETKNRLIRKGHQLAILQSDTSDSGYYQCVRENDAGFEMAFARLEIMLQQDVPDAPENIRVVSVTKTSIKIKWNNARARPCCPVLAYSVSYGHEAEMIDEVTPNTEFELKELEPFVNYSISVLVFSSAGAGPKSKTIVVQTLEDVPSKPVTVTLEPRDTSILVIWDELPVKERNGIIKEYRLYYKRLDSELATESVEQGILGSARSFLITNLDPDTEYAVRMKGGTAVGFKNFQDSEWPWVTVRTQRTLGILPPEIQVVPINATAVNVTWANDGDTKIKGYTIHLRNLSADGSSTTVIELPPEMRQYVLSHLVTDAMYEVTLVREDVDGNSSISAVEFQATEAPLPPAPLNVDVLFSTPDSINIEWYQPHSETEILQFTIKYYEVIGIDKLGTPKIQTSETNSVLLEGLKPFTRYKIFVRAHSEHIASQYSRPVIGVTKEGVPSEPQNIKVTSKDPSSVCIEWSPPAIPNGKITSYIILYTDTRDIRDDSWIRVTKNGSVHSAVIKISDLAGKTYFFKVLASTQSGLGKPTEAIPLVHGEPPYTIKTGTDKPAGSGGGPTEDQTLGILIGISIGVFCIIVCIIIILLRNKYFTTNQNQVPQTQPARFHGNGHIPGNGHAVPTRETPHAVGLYELETYTPMLDHLPENVHSDSKGGGGGNVILTPNGAKLNGFVPLKKNGMRNGQLPNGHMTTVLPSQYKDTVMDAEETRGLIAAMMGDGQKNQPCLSGQVTEDSFTRGRYEDLGSLDDIDRSEEDITNTIGKNSQDDSLSDKSSSSLSASGGEGNNDSLDCVKNRRSIPRSDTTDTGDTVIFRGAAISHDHSVDRPQSWLSENDELSESADGEILSDSVVCQSSGAVLPRSSSKELSEEDVSYQVSQVGCDALPQNQLSTSTNSHVLRSNVVKDDSIASDSSHISNDSRCPPVSISNREPATSADRVHAPARHIHMNGGPHWSSELVPQGDSNLVAGMTRHNHIPLTSSPPHGGGTTLAELPQDVNLSRSDSPPFRRHHYKV